MAVRRKYHPGEVVAEGIYWKSKTGEFIAIAEGGTLPTEEGAAYYRAPPALVLLGGPLLGLAYVLTLPFAVLLTLAHIGLRSGIRAVASIRSGEAEGKAGSRR